MKIAVVLFTYNRSMHTQKTLDALHNNTILPGKMFIFQDGLKCDEHREEWEVVTEIINTVDWCNAEIVVAKENKGLAGSIVDGVSCVLSQYDAAVILEDDYVVHPLFMEYMTKCLNKYRDNKKVFSVNGYSWNTDVVENGTDAYFSGRAGSWGWATWNDRWKLYKQNYKLLAEMKKNSEICYQIDIWGRDLENYLLSNVEGRCDSWAVFWALQCIKQGGFCPTPYYSLVDNIGFDGAGVHCPQENIVTRMRKRTDMQEISLPDKVEFPENYEDAYVDCFRWTSPKIKLKCYNEILLKWNTLLQKKVSIIEYFKKRDISCIAIWGRGDLCKALLYELQNKVIVNSIIESNPRSEQYENIPIIRADNIDSNVQIIVVIPVYDMVNIRRKVKDVNALVGLDEILESVESDYCDGTTTQT